MNQKSAALLGLVLALLGGTMTAFAYLHNTFVTKEALEIIRDDVKEIKSDVKKLLSKQN